MVTVVDVSGNTPTDKRLSSWNRKTGTTPVNTLTPLYVDEVVLDTTTGFMWRATDLTTTGWIAWPARG